MARQKAVNVEVNGSSQGNAPAWLAKLSDASEAKTEDKNVADVEVNDHIEEDIDDIEESVEEEIETEEVEEEEAEEPEIEEDQSIEVKKVDKSLSKEEQDGVQKRINKLTAQRKAIEEENRQLKAKLDAQAAPMPAYIPQIVGDDWLVRPDTGKRVEMPKASDYANNNAQYFEDMHKFNALKQQVIYAVSTSHRNEQAKSSEFNRLKDEYLTVKLPDALEKYPDFSKVVASDAQERFEKAHPWVIEALMESEYGTDIVYKLGKNPKALAALASMKPHQVAKEIGRLEAMEENAVKPKVVSKAPKPSTPPTKLGGMVSGSVKKKSFDNMSISDLRKRLK